MTKKKWSKVEPGDVVEVGGRDWVVEKAKRKGDRVHIVVVSGSNRHEAKVAASDRVKIADDTPAPSKPAKPRPPRRQETTPPKPAEGDPWETQSDRIERKLDEILHARLVGEATDADRGYFVPPVDAQTIMAHMLIFHGHAYEGTEEAALLEHRDRHAAALAGEERLHLNHWHTDKRPTTAKKKGKK